MGLRRSLVVAVVTSAVLLSTQQALAQGAGVIAGVVTDGTGATVPGVEVTIAGSTLTTARQAVTDATGAYQFQALAPGRYRVRFTLVGFKTGTENIVLSPGGTMVVNASLELNPIEETIVLDGGEDPHIPIDFSSTRVQTRFSELRLGAIPHAGDLWGLLSVIPGVQMGRFDIGGNRSGNQTSYRAYGFGGQDQQVRILVEGIDTTDGRAANGFFQDYGSHEEVTVSAAGNGAAMPTPGVMTQMIGRSGTNIFRGEVSADFEDNALQGSNISSDLIASGIAPGSNEIQRRVDAHASAGGPVQRDRLWYYAGYRQLRSAIDQVNLRYGEPLDTNLYNATGKVTYRIPHNHTLVGYYQWGKKLQPNRGWNANYNFFAFEDTTRQDDGSWVWKGEWSAALSSRWYVESRFGGFGYYLPLTGNGDEPFRQDTGTRVSSGGDRKSQTDRDRKQWTGAATTLWDEGGREHRMTFGAEMNMETAWTGFERTRAGHIEHIFNSGRPTQVILGFPTADGAIGDKAARDRLLSVAKANRVSAFVSDSWTISPRLTVNAGVRFDRYSSSTPEQRQLAFTNGPVSLPATVFPEQSYFNWNAFVPRVGVVVDLDGQGRTVAKVHYGFFKHNPSFDIAMAANPNQATKTITYQWGDRNNDRLYQTGEEGAVIATALAGGVSFDSDTRQPSSHEVTAFLERAVGPSTQVRIGVVHKTNSDLWQPYRPFRPISGYTSPFLVRDIGADGITGTADDRDLTFFGTPNATLGDPATVIQTVPAFGRYTAIDVGMTRYLSRGWSAGGGFSYSWTHEHNNNYIGNNVSPVGNPGYPNSPNEMIFTNGDDGAHRFTIWDVKAYGTWDAPFRIRLTPLLRLQAGQPYGRVLQVSAPQGCACTFNGQVLVEPLDTRRMDTVAVFDVRAETTVPIGDRLKARLFVDVFNLFNTDAFDVISYSTGSAFQLPTSIVAPRVARIGARLAF